jgi:hypothetical protein
VVFLDSDDLWFPWTLATYRQAIGMYGKPAVVMGTPARFQRPEELARVKRGTLKAHAFADYFATAEEPFVRTACIVAVRTEALRRVGGFAPLRIISEDHDLLYRLGTEPGFVWMEEPLVVGYRQHGGSSARDFERSYQGLCYLLEQEQAGRYPGGEERRHERLTMILHSVRHVTQWLVVNRRPVLALDLYRRSLREHLVAPRWRYLLGFPPWMVASSLRRAWR